MSRKEYNLSQEDVCIWFKSHLEGHTRIELMCSLIDICLPLELRFLGTYLEYAAGKHHAHLQKWERDANNPASFLITDLADAKTRRRICLFMTLLHSHNKAIATKLFDVLSLYDNLASFFQIPGTEFKSTDKNDKVSGNGVNQNELNTSTVDENPKYHELSCNEFKLLLTLSSFHPAFSFEQRRTIREKLEQFVALTRTVTEKNVPDSTIVTGLSEDLSSKSDMVSSQLPGTCFSQKNNPENSTISTVDVNSQTGASQKQGGLLPTPLLELYPQYIPIPGNFTHPNQPILIPSSITVLNPHEQMMCVQTAPNITTTPQYVQTIPIQKMNTLVNKNSLLDNSGVQSLCLSSQQDVLQSVQYPSFQHSNNSKRSCETSERETGTLKQPQPQPVLIQNSIPFQVMNNNFSNTTELLPAADINSNWGSEKSLNSLNNNQQACRTERTSTGSTGDIRVSGSEVDIVSQKLDTNVSDTTCVHACGPTRSVVSDTTTVISPNFVHCNTNNLGDYAMLCKSKVIGLPYTRGDGANILPGNQLRPVLVAKNLTELNNIRNLHPNMPQLITPINLHNMTQLNKKNNSTCSLNTLASDVLTVSYSNRDSIVSSVPKIYSPQAFRSSEKPTLPTGINGGYLTQQICQDSYHGGSSSMESHHRQPGTQNQAHAEKISSKVSPITVNVNRKKNSSFNKHILSPSGGGQLSGDNYESSPAISPSHSPRRSPYSSPSTSPMSNRKDHTNSKHIDAYASATNWLKSLRLHKYSHKFEGYSFQMMKDLSDESLSELISTKGAQTKFKQNIEQLVKQGFVEFSSPDNPIMNDDSCSSGCHHISSPSDGSPNSKTKNVPMINNTALTNNNTTVSNDIQSFLLTPVVDTQSPQDYRNVSNFYNNDLNDTQSKIPGKIPDKISPRGYFEETSGRMGNELTMDEDSYEEVLTSRKQHVNLATCYNCGAKGHYGHQCIEETMEAQTYSRYAFQLDFTRRESFSNAESKTESGSLTSR